MKSVLSSSSSRVVGLFLHQSRHSLELLFDNIAAARARRHCGRVVSQRLKVLRRTLQCHGSQYYYSMAPSLLRAPSHPPQLQDSGTVNAANEAAKFLISVPLSSSLPSVPIPKTLDNALNLGPFYVQGGSPRHLVASPPCL